MKTKTGVGEFGFWNDENHGFCIYRHSEKYFKDILGNKKYELIRTEEISKNEYLKCLRAYIKLLKDERF